MTPKISLVTAVVAALVLGVPAGWGQTGPDAFQRAVLAGERTQPSRLESYRDAFERAVGAGQPTAGVSRYVDAHGRFDPGVSTPAVATYPDAFERALSAGAAGVAVSDSHERVTPTPSPGVAPLVSDGRDIEWPQVGVGFGVGILLALGLGLALRVTRVRMLAH